MGAAEKKANGKNQMGRLTSIGITEPFNVALLLPTDFDDLRHPITDFIDANPSEGAKVVFRGTLHGHLQTVFQIGGEKGAPRMTAHIADR